MFPIKGKRLNQSGFNTFTIFLNIQTWTNHLHITTCQPSPFCYVCDNNHISVHMSVCAPSEEGGEQWLSEVTRDDWVCKTRHYHDSHTSGKNACASLCVCVCLWSVTTGCTSFHLWDGAARLRQADGPRASEAGAMGTTASGAVVTPHNKLAIYCNSSQCHNSGDVHFKRCHFFFFFVPEASNWRIHSWGNTMFFGVMCSCDTADPPPPVNSSRAEMSDAAGDQCGYVVQPLHASIELSFVGARLRPLWRAEEAPRESQWLTLWERRGVRDRGKVPTSSPSVITAHTTHRN